MKAISLLQPFATLVMLGYKQLETRSWATKHRGPLAIHASLGKSAEIRRLCQENSHIRQLLDYFKLTYDTLPRGAVLGLVEVTGMLKISEPGTGIKLGCCDPATLKPVERAVGDYTAGRWAWQLKQVQPFPTPVACTGALSVWQVPEAVEAQFPFSPTTAPYSGHFTGTACGDLQSFDY